MLEIGFQAPSRLWALILVPILLGIYVIWAWSRRSRRARDQVGLNVLFPKRAAWKRHLAVVAAVAALASLTLAWAMP
ncbi:MAG: magnesium chelatase, partial [Propionibacteriaceae bacterium]|nr:magnesium chelatase [Propionibacteriaceae bacterium]